MDNTPIVYEDFYNVPASAKGSHIPISKICVFSELLPWLKGHWIYYGPPKKYKKCWGFKKKVMRRGPRLIYLIGVYKKGVWELRYLFFSDENAANMLTEAAIEKQLIKNADQIRICGFWRVIKSWQ